MFIHLNEKIVTIPSAEMMRERAAVRAEEIAREEALARLEREAREQREAMERLMKMPEIIEAIMQDIVEATEKGQTWVNSKTWYYSNKHWGMDHHDVRKLAPVISEVLGQAGYYVNPTVSEYSKSWQNKSGKLFTWGHISWT